MASQPTPRLAIPAQWIPLPGGFSTKKRAPAGDGFHERKYWLFNKVYRDPYIGV